MSTRAEPKEGVTKEESWLDRLPKVAVVSMALLLFLYAWTFKTLPINESPAAWGSFGDYIGGLLNPLISLFTLVVAVQVWRLQKTELLETRRAVKEQGSTADQQRREQRFFDFLNIYRSTVDSIEFEVADKSGSLVSLKGKRAFKFLTSLNSSSPLTYLSGLFQTGHWEKWTAHSEIQNIPAHWNAASPVLDHYFRIVFTLLREAEPTLKDDCWRYMKLLRAQLSRDEVNLLAMNLLFDEEGKKMQSLVARYGLLKHMPSNVLRSMAERQLSVHSFGRSWASVRTAEIPKEQYAP